MHTTDQLNTALAGRYLIDRKIGEGGMATVYLARDFRHKRRVALKVLKPDLGAVVGSERFLSEIQVTANLQHPNLLPLFDSGEADGLLFYVMPFVEGESLRARLQREKQLPIEEAVRIATAIGGALDYAHRHGVIHRDLKPENILLNEGQPLVADFGIALAVSNAGGNRITQTGLSLGTPQYMSPEQATGDRVIDGRTDIYSLGALTYEMLTGEPPHTGNTSQAVIARVLTENPRPIRVTRPSVPEHVDDAVSCALEKLPADRWATAKDMCDALVGSRVGARPTSVLGPVARGRRAARARLFALGGWAVAAAATAVAAFLLLRAEPPRPRAVPMSFEFLPPPGVEATARGSAAGVAISADGSTIVFQGAATNDVFPGLYMRRMDDREIQRIRGADSARAPVLSPDGSEVVFLGGPIGGGGGAGGGGSGAVLKRVPLRGGSARTLYTSVGNVPPLWTEGGDLLFVEAGTVFLGSPEGGQRRRVAGPDSARGLLRLIYPEMLPGGNTILVAIQKGEGLDSMVLGYISLPDGRVTELGIRGTFPRYSGTGHLLYATGDAWLMAVPFDAARRQVTGSPVPLAEGLRVGTGGAAAFSVARNGTLVYLPGEQTNGDRIVVFATRTGVKRPTGMRPAFYLSPRASPDGRQIAISVSTQGGFAFRNPDVWRFDTTSKTMYRITTDSNSLRPLWSSDGGRIAYVRRPIDTLVMWRPLYSAGQSTPLFRARQGISDFALGDPRGYSVVKIDAGNNASGDIWLVHADSADAPRPLLAEPYQEFSPAISPDGKLLAYVTNRTGRNEVYVRALAGDGPELQISVDGGQEPVWSRTGTELFYRGSDWLLSAHLASAPSLAIARRDSLFRDTFSRPGIQTPSYDALPNGEFVMLQSASELRQASPLVVLMNWHQRPGLAATPR